MFICEDNFAISVIANKSLGNIVYGGVDKALKDECDIVMVLCAVGAMM